MEKEPPKLDLKSVKKDIRKCILESTIRGIVPNAKWLSEVNYALKDVDINPSEIHLTDPTVYGTEYDKYLLAKSLFNVKEYERCTWNIKKCRTPICRFLRWYATFLAIEKKKAEALVDDWQDPENWYKMEKLLNELKEEYSSKKMDCYLVFLYALVLKKMDLTDMAMKVFVESLHEEPLQWCAWMELADLIHDRSTMISLRLPDHWMYKFFAAHIFLELQLNDEALEIYTTLQTLGFQHSTYLQAQTALAYNSNRELEPATLLFCKLTKADPYRLENLEIYSNLLYVGHMSVELSILANHACSVDKYREETCCIIGNYYSLRGEHNRAILNYKRAIRLNPGYLVAWTLLGHEYIEMKDTNSAILSYRKALEFNRRDFHAWYGLGQIYEILKMTNYAAYFYRQAQHYRTNDSRMLLALGDVYVKMERLDEALKCFYKAHNVGDLEGMAAIKLAKMYEKRGMLKKAMLLYTEFVEDTIVITVDNKPDFAHAYRFLTKHHMAKFNLTLAQEYALKCLTYEETKEDGKYFLKAIALTNGTNHTLHERVPVKVINNEVFTPCPPSTSTGILYVPSMRYLNFSTDI